jgi:hypothetical protein
MDLRRPGGNSETSGGSEILKRQGLFYTRSESQLASYVGMPPHFTDDMLHSALLCGRMPVEC